MRSPPPSLRRIPLLALGFLPLVASSASADDPFRIEVVELGSVGTYTSLALDANRNPHVVYWDLSNQTLRYATRSNGAWTTEVIHATGFVGNETSIAIDAQGRVHVSWHNFTAFTQVLRYAVRDGGVWSVEAVDSTTVPVGRYNSIALDADGVPHISYYDLNNTALKYADRTGGSWTLETVIGDEDSGQYSSLAFDPQGNPLISYYHDETAWASLDLARKLDGAWETRDVDFQPIVDRDVGRYSSMAVDGQGRIHIAYQNSEFQRLSYALLDNFDDVALLESIDAGPDDVGEDVSLAVNAEGDPRVSYYNVTRGDLMSASKPGVNWQLQTVHSGGAVGRYTSLALDEQGTPYVSYHDATRGALGFADAGLQLLSPVAGETWPVGAERTIRWIGIGEVDVSLSVDGGNSFTTIAADVAASDPGGGFTLTVPHRPSRFGVVAIERAGPFPFASARNDSFFTIETDIVLLNLSVAPLSEAPGMLVSWSTDPGPEDLAGYRLDRLETGGAWRTLVASTPETSYRDLEGTLASRYRLWAVNGLGSEFLLGESDGSGLPALTSRLEAWPSPYAGGRLTVAFAAPSIGGQPLEVEVTVHDLAGRRVATVANGRFGEGVQLVTWDGRDESGRRVPGGLYFLRVTSELFQETRKLVIFGE